MNNKHPNQNTLPPKYMVDRLLNFLAKLDHQDSHDIISGLIADCLEEMGFDAELEHFTPYAIKPFKEIEFVAGRIDVYATKGNHSIACEVEGERIPTKTLRKLYKKTHSLKLIVLRSKACTYVRLPFYLEKIPNVLIYNIKRKEVHYSNYPPYSTITSPFKK